MKLIGEQNVSLIIQLKNGRLKNIIEEKWNKYGRRGKTTNTDEKDKLQQIQNLT